MSGRGRWDEKVERTSCQIVLDLYILFRSHAKESGDAVAVVISVRETPAHRCDGGGGLVDVGHGGDKTSTESSTGRRNGGQ